MIDFVASERQYVDHLAPVWKALPFARRGSFIVPPGLAEYTEFVAGAIPSGPVITGDIVVGASWGDVNGCHPSQRRVLMEHGIGQTYQGLEWNQRYAGAGGRDSISMFLAPNQRVYDLNTRATPGARHEIVGSPRVDDLQRVVAASRPLVGFTVSFHFNTEFCDEITSAFEWIRPQLELLPDWIGHAHPRHFHTMEMQYRRMGRQAVPHFPLALALSSVYVCDNSSTIYEAAAVGRPVVLLNAPQYRRDVHHGLRFWDMADVGVQVDDKLQLGPAIELARMDPAGVADRRAEIVDELFPFREESAARAVGALLSL